MWMWRCELIHVGHVVRESVCRFENHPAQKHYNQRNAHKFPAPSPQSCQQPATEDEKKWVSGKKIPDAQIQMTSHGQARVEREWQKQKQKAPLVSDRKTPESPTKCRE